MKHILAVYDVDPVYAARFAEVVNSVHSREGCYLYLKDVVEGKTEVLLGSEEKEALERALGYK